MNKNSIRQHLRFISEAEGSGTPGITVTSSVHKKSGEENKKGVKAIEKDLATYDKSLKQDGEIKKTTPNKFNYEGDSEKKYHDEMEIMNGQEMIEYDREPNKEFKDRAKEALEGSSRMGNKGGKDMGNAEATWGASSDDFGKKRVKDAADSFKKRTDAVKGVISFGDDIEMIDKNYKPIGRHSALSESTEFNGQIPDLFYPYSQSIIKIVSDVNNPTTEANYIEKSNRIINALRQKLGDNPNFETSLPQLYRYIADLAGISPNHKKNVGENSSAASRNIEYGNPYGNEDTYDAKEKFNNDNNKTQIKESMKRLKFKKEFNGVGNALKMIPESYKVDEKIFEMTDGNETYKIRWEGTLNEGRAVILMASDKSLINEDMQKMKHLMGYKSQETLGLVKGKARLDENAMFSDIWGKTKTLLEGEDIEDSDAKEGDLDDAVSNAPEAKKHVHMGSASTDKGTQAPAPKTGSMESLDDVKSHAPEAKKHVHMGKTTESSVGMGLGDQSEKEEEWEKTKVPQAAEAKKHVHMGEGIEINGKFFEFINENILDEEDENEFGTNAVTGEPLPDPASQMVTEEDDENNEELETK
jgi:hypothetical protein